MMFAEVILLILGGAGHLVFWVGVVNRVHAWALPRWLIETVTMLSGAALVILPAIAAVDYGSVGWTSWPPSPGRTLLLLYLSSGLVVSAVASVDFWRLLRQPECPALISNHTRVVDIPRMLGKRPASGVPGWLSRLPGNEIFHLSIHEEQLRVPRLAAAHDGLRIAHLSDLHMSGRIHKSYYEEVVRQTNALEPDLVAITGDLFDRSECLAWTADTYGRLQARYGVYFVLGNHDRRVDHGRAVQLLEEVGLVYLGGRWMAQSIGGQPVFLAGNELPWFPPAADVETMPSRHEDEGSLRIVLSHSPDQFAWAQAADFDLALAGHTHGGQVRFPGLGAVLAPSLEGTRFAAGMFQVGPTLMHVSRGTSNLAPFRWNCPPELALLQLHPA